MTDPDKLDPCSATISLEHTNPATVGISDSAGALPVPIRSCLELVSGAAIDPSRVTLVITGDFVRSVRERLPRDQRHLYHPVRGGGVVGAKTMKIGDDVHVVVPAFWFERVDAPSSDYVARDKFVQRMLLHEAQHVTLLQAGEDDVLTHSGQGEARWNLLACADSVISEYRAELGVGLSFRSDEPPRSPDEVLTQLRSDLRRIVTVEFQVHRNPGKLAHDVVAEALVAWKALGNIAAERVVGGIALDQEFSPVVEGLFEWKSMAAPHWKHFTDILIEIPPPETRITPGALYAQTERLADLFDLWLSTLGFKWNDVDQSFWVTSWRLYE